MEKLRHFVINNKVLLTKLANGEIDYMTDFLPNIIKQTSMRHLNNCFWFLIGIVAIVIFFSIINQKSPSILYYDEVEGFVIDTHSEDEITACYDTTFVMDEWRKDSIRLDSEIFETKCNITSCTNVLNTVHGFPNDEYLLEKVLYEKEEYKQNLDSLKKEKEELMKDERRFDNSISYIKLTCIIIKKHNK